ncbi:MAG: dihydrofolate reductase family protein [Micromonosporaceae bacterium]
MDRPRVTIHNLISLDGRLDGFPADVGLYYELAARFPHEAILTGSTTVLAAAASQGIDMSKEDPQPPPAPTGPAAAREPLPILVIVDSRGRLTRYAWLRGQPFWRDVLVLCSGATPAGHLALLHRHNVIHLVAGDSRVDLGAALRALAERHQVTAVRVDAGGALNGALLSAGLVDEISVVIAPYLAGGTRAGSLRLIAGANGDEALSLDLTAVDRLRQGHVWLRYAVRAYGITGVRPHEVT